MSLYMPSRRRVRVSVGVSRPRPVTQQPVGCCVVALCPAEHPWLHRFYPRAEGGRSRGHAREEAVEHLRLHRGHDLRHLPGLDATTPSLLRDSVRMAFAAGAKQIDLAVVRRAGVQPWELHRPAVQELVQPVLEHLPGVVLLYPDAAGAPSLHPRGPSQEEQHDRWRRLRRMILASAQSWRERYQVALLNLPPGLEDRVEGDFAGLWGTDVALCRWVGSVDRLRGQGWRSAAAALAGDLSVEPLDVARGLLGRQIRLGPGRAVQPSHRYGLERPRPTPPEPPFADALVNLAIDERFQLARVLSDPTLRGRNQWSLPAVRTVKAIHQRVLLAAEVFVFRPVKELQAIGLTTALAEVLRPFILAGVLLGPGGEGQPRLSVDLSRDPATPGFIVEIEGQLRPWCRVIKLKVNIHHEDSVRLEEV